MYSEENFGDEDEEFLEESREDKRKKIIGPTSDIKLPPIIPLLTQTNALTLPFSQDNRVFLPYPIISNLLEGNANTANLGIPLFQLSHSGTLQSMSNYDFFWFLRCKQLFLEVPGIPNTNEESQRRIIRNDDNINSNVAHEVPPENKQIQHFDSISHPGVDSKGPIFELVSQPAPLQRKSYSYESRWIRPAPLIIQFRNGLSLRDTKEIKAKLASATVTARLVTTNDKDITTSSLEGETLSRFDSTYTAKMFLKVNSTTNDIYYRLVFEVNYDSPNGRQTETIRSKPFQVNASNREKVAEPTVTGINPPHGRHNKEKEVWIKGTGFSGEVSVKFGSKKATVLETYENLIVVKTPTYPEATSDMEVQVTVSNTISDSRQPTKYLFKYFNEKETSTLS